MVKYHFHLYWRKATLTFLDPWPSLTPLPYIWNTVSIRSMWTNTSRYSVKFHEFRPFFLFVCFKSNISFSFQCSRVIISVDACGSSIREFWWFGSFSKTDAIFWHGAMRWRCLVQQQLDAAQGVCPLLQNSHTGLPFILMRPLQSTSALNTALI